MNDRGRDLLSFLSELRDYDAAVTKVEKRVSRAGCFKVSGNFARKPFDSCDYRYEFLNHFTKETDMV